MPKLPPHKDRSYSYSMLDKRKSEIFKGGCTSQNVK